MKQLIISNRAYKLWAEVTEVEAPVGYKNLKLTSTFEGSRIPNEERRVFELMLSPEDAVSFKKLIETL